LEKQDIIRFWRDIEIFDLPDLNKDAVLIDLSVPLPWEQKVKEPKKNYKWRYTILFGKTEKKHIIDYLNTLLKADAPNDWEETLQGFSCFSALILDEEGRYQQDSYIIASYIFGINALEKKKSLASVSVELDKAMAAFYERYNIFQNYDNDDDDKISGKGDIVNFNHLNKEIAYLKTLTPWSKKEIRTFLLVEEVPKDSEPNPSFMNSFYLNDLNHLSTKKEKNLSTSLQRYLQLEPNVKTRKDIIKDKQSLFDAINPIQMTAGRWPSNVEHGLYAAQAGALNTIFSNLRNQEGIQGVNGPPGTGKTTLLLDVIAEIIVERAKVISGLGCDGIFQKGYKKIEKEEGYDLYTYNLHSSLQNNFGIVVASNNNAAVENISKELPLKRKIDAEHFPDAEYFSECSSKLIDDESWGVLAAALGNAKNRSKFKKAFWKSKKDERDFIGFEDLLYDVYKDENNDSTNIHRKSFNNLNNQFKTLLKDFEFFIARASSFHNQLPTFIENKKQEKSLKAELTRIDNDLLKLEKEKLSIQNKELDTKKEVEGLQIVSKLHVQRKPSFFFFQKLFNTNSFKKWDSEATKIFKNLSNKLSEVEDLKKSLQANENKNESLVSIKSEHTIALSQLESFFNNYKNLENVLIQEYGISDRNLFNMCFCEKDVSNIHLLNPYHSPKIAKLRSDIFLTALQLHRSVILANAKKIRNNLNAYFEMTAGWIKVDSGISQNLWDVFFLCVPVVSTTLASASRLFPNLKMQQIGWLLIDEAGQATPQSAVGIIYRSKRCVIVGDPLQVEPVVTIPEKLVTKLRSEHRVSVDWSPYKTSVQQLSDRISFSGTYMAVGDMQEKIWTGFPLRTHRRCDDPMFSIANEIAYSDQMVKAVKDNSEEVFIGDSTWFNVNSDTVTLINKHVIKEEISLLTQKIAELRNGKYDGDIYIISPFKSVASYCDTAFKHDRKISCGTIHKFQGKEADIVFLVLGSDPKSSGARNWASKKPNMLNVALTRAKKRFYVIGCKKNWGACNYYSTMLHALS